MSPTLFKYGKLWFPETNGGLSATISSTRWGALTCHWSGQWLSDHPNQKPDHCDTIFVLCIAQVEKSNRKEVRISPEYNTCTKTFGFIFLPLNKVQESER